MLSEPQNYEAINLHFINKIFSIWGKKATWRTIEKIHILQTTDSELSGNYVIEIME